MSLSRRYQVLLYKIIFDRFDTSSAQSDVSFVRLILILKMALIGSFDCYENINGSQNKAPKTIEVWTDICQNYHTFILSLLRTLNE